MGDMIAVAAADLASTYSFFTIASFVEAPQHDFSQSFSDWLKVRPSLASVPCEFRTDALTMLPYLGAWTTGMLTYATVPHTESQNRSGITL